MSVQVSVGRQLFRHGTYVAGKAYVSNMTPNILADSFNAAPPTDILLTGC